MEVCLCEGKEASNGNFGMWEKTYAPILRKEMKVTKWD